MEGCRRRSGLSTVPRAKQVSRQHQPSASQFANCESIPDHGRPALHPPVRALEETREPDRAPAGQARLHPEAQRADLPRLPTERAATPDLPRRQHTGRAPATRRLAEVGQALPPRAIRQAHAPNHRAALKSRGSADPSPLQRPRRAGQHPNPPDRPARLRLPLTRGSHRPRDAVTRWPLPTPPRPVTPPTDRSVGSKMGLARKPAGPYALELSRLGTERRACRVPVRVAYATRTSYRSVTSAARPASAWEL
jgi:hypothetical protein